MCLLTLYHESMYSIRVCRYCKMNFSMIYVFADDVKLIYVLYIRICKIFSINLRVICVFADFCSCGSRKLDSYLYCQFPELLVGFSFSSHFAYAMETFGDFFVF